MARENLAYFDRVLAISRDRFKAGDIARVDLDRLELQRVQYESDFQTAETGVRTAKIKLLMLLNDRTPVDQFDVTGPFDFSEPLTTLEDLRQAALAARPDLQAAVQAVDKAQTDHKLAVANGSTDPTFGVDFARNPPIPLYIGFSVNIPLRIFDRNQGEKARTEIDIQRNRAAAGGRRGAGVQRRGFGLRHAERQPGALAAVQGQIPGEAARVRDTISFAYQRGGAALVDFLDAQSDYRAVQVAYLNLVGSYLTAAGQLNLAVGREVIQ